MSDFESMGARRVQNQLEQDVSELAATQHDALESFMELNPVPSRIRTPVNLAKEYLFATEARCRETVDTWMQKLLADDLASEEDLETISLHLYRKLADLQSAADSFTSITDSILSTDLNAILRRHKGE